MPSFSIALGLGAMATLALALAALATLTLSDRRTDLRVAASLLASADPAPSRFDPAMIAGLPEPARRFLRFAIAPGTPLHRSVSLQMEGEFALGTREAPGYAPMTAWQVLAAPLGFVWQMRRGIVGGSDGLGPDGSWTRFRLAGLVPVARSGGDQDHRRSAFARAVAEGVIWTPAIALPGPGVRWQATGPDSARVTFSSTGLSQSVDLILATDGAPASMVMPRWSDANPDRQYRLQPFGARFGRSQVFAGFRIPVDVEAGNFFGTPDYFPFFRVRVTAAAFGP